MHALDVSVEFVVFDNDSTMRYHMCHTGTVKECKLHLDVPQLSFLYDPSYRIKVRVKDVFRLTSMSKGKR